MQSRWFQLKGYLLRLCCLVTFCGPVAQLCPSAQEVSDQDFFLFRLSGTGMHLGYTSLNKWLRAHGAKEFAQIEPGVWFDMGGAYKRIWASIGVGGVLQGRKEPTQTLVLFSGGPRLSAGQLHFAPGLGLGLGYTKTSKFPLPNYSCSDPRGDCYTRSMAYWGAVQLNSLYKFPGRKSSFLVLGGFFMPAYRLSRNQWEYGYFIREGSEDSEWVGTRVSGMPSTPRLVLVAGLSIGVGIWD